VLLRLARRPAAQLPVRSRREGRELFACSGPGADMAIARNIEIGYSHATVAGGLFLVSLGVFALGPRRWAAPAVLLCLLALHPAWTISARSGDCGHMKRDASWGFTALGSIVLCCQVGHCLWARRHPNAGVPEEYLRVHLDKLSEQQRDAIRQLARSGRTVEAIQQAECILGVTLGSAPGVAKELQR
jgi:hypothetical protein